MNDDQPLHDETVYPAGCEDHSDQWTTSYGGEMPLAWSAVTDDNTQVTLQAEFVDPADGAYYADTARYHDASKGSAAAALDFTLVGNPISIRKVRAGACNFISVLTKGTEKKGLHQTISWGRAGIRGHKYHRFTVERPDRGFARDPDEEDMSPEFAVFIQSDIVHVNDTDPQVLKELKNDTAKHIVKLLLMIGAPDSLYIDVDRPVTGLSMLGALYASFTMPYSVMLIVCVPLYVDENGLIQMQLVDENIARIKTETVIEYSLRATKPPFCVLGLDTLKYAEIASAPSYPSQTTTVQVLMSQHYDPTIVPDWLIVVAVYSELPLALAFLSAYLLKSLQNAMLYEKGGGEKGAIDLIDEQQRAADAKNALTTAIRVAFQQVKAADLPDLDAIKLMKRRGYDADEAFKALRRSDNAAISALATEISKSAQLFNMDWWKKTFPVGLPRAEELARIHADSKGQPTEQNIANAMANLDPFQLIKWAKSLINLNQQKATTNVYATKRLVPAVGRVNPFLKPPTLPTGKLPKSDKGKRGRSSSPVKTRASAVAKVPPPKSSAGIRKKAPADTASVSSSLVSKAKTEIGRPRRGASNLIVTGAAAQPLISGGYLVLKAQDASTGLGVLYDPVKKKYWNMNADMTVGEPRPSSEARAVIDAISEMNETQ